MMYSPHRGLKHTMLEKIEWGLAQNFLGNDKRCFCKICGPHRLCGIERQGKIFMEKPIHFNPPELAAIPCTCEHDLFAMPDFPGHPCEPAHSLSDSRYKIRGDEESRPSEIVPVAGQPFLVINDINRQQIMTNCGSLDNHPEEIWKSVQPAFPPEEVSSDEEVAEANPRPSKRSRH